MIRSGMSCLVSVGLFLFVGCSGDSKDNQAGARTSGGTAAATGGQSAVPSSSGGKGNSVGGATTAAGNSNLGGTSRASSTTAVGGRTAVGGAGGAATTGGASNWTSPVGGAGTGGSNTSSAGMSSSIGGSPAQGGTSSFGGSSALAGGAASTGGSIAVTGGASNTGGSSVSPGGATSGGMPSIGGTNAAGGTPATGGISSAGGNTSTAWQSGCLLRLGGLPEIAPAGVGDIGDFNGDGILDVVLGAISGNNVRVLLGRGNGVYGDAVTYDIDGAARAVAVGDLDGDGILDIATRNSDNGNISVLKGGGDGTFALSKTVPASSDSGSGFPKQNIVLADVTGDGRLDILTAHWDQTISIAVAMSNGSFTRLSPISIGHPATQLTVADLNNDHVLDVIVNHGYSNTISVLLGTGGGTFASQVNYSIFEASSWYAEAITIGDVDKDGDPDVVVGNGAGAAIALLTNTGNGTLSAPVATNVSGAVNYVQNVQLLDLEADGDADLLVDVNGDGALYYLWNNGSGAFTTITRDYVANAALDIRVGDSNGDGVQDLFLFGHKFLTLLGRGSGKFESQKYLLSDSASSPVSIAVGNFDGVGVLDVALANEATNSSSVFLLDSNGVYSVPSKYTVGTKPSFIRAAEVTGDGKTDLLNLNYQGGTINVLKNTGSGTFTVLTGFSVLGFKNWFDLKDVNEDGALDVVMLIGTSACVYPGTGTGAFGTCTSFVVSNGSAMEAMVLGDVNNDGHLDAVANGNSRLNVWQGKGDGTFATSLFYSDSSYGTKSMALGDLNGDQKPDLVMASDSSGLQVWLGHGDGTFTANKTYGVSNSLERVQIADMNRDGLPDVVLADSDHNALIVMLGKGDGTLDTKFFSYPAGEHPTDLAIADLNDDGWLDVATPGYESSSAGVLFGGPPVCPIK